MPGLYDETEIEETDATDDETSEETTDSETNDDVSDRIKKIEEDQTLMKVLADPDVQRVLEMKKTGKQIDVKERAEEKDPEFDVPDDDPASELLKKISGLMDRKLNPLKDRVEVVEKVAQHVQTNEVNGQIDKVKSKHGDFEQYKEKMILLSQENPGLNVEELYLMAKMRAGKLNLAEPSTFSEKPTTQPRGAMKRSGAVRGRHAFNEIVQKALGKLDLDSLE